MLRLLRIGIRRVRRARRTSITPRRSLITRIRRHSDFSVFFSFFGAVGGVARRSLGLGGDVVLGVVVALWCFYGLGGGGGKEVGLPGYLFFAPWDAV